MTNSNFIEKQASRAFLIDCLNKAYEIGYTTRGEIKRAAKDLFNKNKNYQPLTFLEEQEIFKNYFG